MSEQQVLPEWECFRDSAYYDMWCVRRVGEGRFGFGYHVSSEAEAKALRDEMATTLASLAQSEAERERHVRHIMDISIALDVPVGMNAVEYGKQLRAERERLQGEAEKLKSRRVHTQEWYASHYAKLQDWARKILPEPWRNQFFSCIANGTYDHMLDVGEAYICKAGFKVVPSGYIHMDTAEGQIIRDQTTRAEDAEADLARERELNQGLRHTNDTLTGIIAIQVEKIAKLQLEDKSKPVVTNTEEEK